LERNVTLLITGLLLFLGSHSMRIFADAWRSRQVALRGEGVWKGAYALLALLGLALIVWGYGEARATPISLWQPPLWTRHLAATLMLPVFVLWVAAYLPGNRLRAKIGHPMVVGVKLWAFVHLLANGTLADLVLFGAFLIWAALDYSSLRRRDRATGKTWPAGTLQGDLIAVALGLAAYVVFAIYLHPLLIGVRVW
jgi:uncharacterized membrane protein